MHSRHHCFASRWCIPVLALACTGMLSAPGTARATPQSWLKHLKKADQTLKEVKQIKGNILSSAPSAKHTPKATNSPSAANGSPATDRASTRAASAGPAGHSDAGAAGAPGVPADFGTAAGTNRLAKIAIRLPDIRGIRLGMPANEVEAAVKAALPGATVTREYFGLRPLPGRRLSSTMAARKTGPMVNGEQHDETFTMVLTSYPSEVRATSIRRSVVYTSQEAPSVANTVATLQRKYGPATVTRPDVPSPRLSWIFDTQGHFVTPARYEQLHHKGGDCADIDRALPRNILLSAGGSDPRQGCTPWTTLTVRLDVRRLAPQNEPWPKSWAGYAGYVVHGMMLDFVDNLLAHSSAEALRTAAMDVENAKARKAKARASGNTPTF